jgi:Fem-1 homolog b
LQEEQESNLMTALYLLVLVTQLSKTQDAEVVHNTKKLIYRLNKLKVTLRDGQTLLHLAVSAETPVDDFHTNDVCK